MVKKLLIRNKFFVPLVTIPIILSLIGLVFIFEASAIRSVSAFGDSLHYLKYQAIWLAIGFFVMMFFSYFDYKKLYFFSFISLGVTILLLMIVLIPGIGLQAGGARRWIDFGWFNVQPTELSKFSVIIYLSSWFIHREKRRFLSFLTLVGFLIFLIILQPDMGTAIIVFLLSLIIYYLAGMNIFNLFLLIPVAAAGFFLLIKAAPYRLNRLTAFLNPSTDPQGIGYHINQILISLSQGGLFGQGFGSSRQKYLFLPEAHTDSIFAIIAEEYGFVGSLMLIILYFIFIYKIYHLIRLSPDKLSKLIAAGVFAFFNLQIIINLAGMVGLFPLTGVPLPFISYGGSNLLISFALIGILLNIEKRVKV
ncbi:MAG: Stage V sporulation protein E (Required for spore cortex synthesis) [Candidatus Roizmanbacteria bacterium GW2011_GWC2_37_13]|uniref:Probable peptidoglycan glycosyltransferase FtsW n=1 Tax=Candidatus Roizmanbacteria bacterium GW2011_GWC2_37_13 TaxID=1618486 RepID=A0A0G0G5U4_9BACT|nr:MAG: Stage V sporulation protein E (Required for spore cortex synthesis) [Candidatus Roizmanbacteria bacterium GW2011_GWC1_37_12]KKQ26488.1 MAG: Stage V sporulation protein E (Required for spore cortex synthesis) [Candidatus Roizmanbacteria bacterium GW2011_GWC2_37_13]